MEMNQQWIEQYNKRCALFLGATYSEIAEAWGFGNVKNIGSKMFHGIMYHNVISADRFEKELKFHSDWNWIMEVVEIIEELDVVASFTIEQPTIYIWKSSEESNFKDIEIDINTSSKKEAVVKAIDQFLIWNEQQNK